MTNKDDLLKMAYEQAMASFTREAQLLFERMNFLIAAMAFLVAAFAALLTNKMLAHSLITYSVMFLGIILAVIFFVVNLSTIKKVVLKHRDYIYITEKELFALSDKPGPYQRTLPNLDPEKRGGLEENWPGIHTVVVPIVFYFFWVLTFVYMWQHSCPYVRLISGIILIVITVVAFLYSFFHIIHNSD